MAASEKSGPKPAVNMAEIEQLKMLVAGADKRKPTYLVAAI